MEELRCHHVLRPASQSRLGFCKFEQDFGGGGPPRAPASLSNHGDERQTIFHAEALGGDVVAFEILVTDERWDVASATSDSKVESERRAAAPAWQIDVRRAGRQVRLV